MQEVLDPNYQESESGRFQRRPRPRNLEPGSTAPLGLASLLSQRGHERLGGRALAAEGSTVAAGSGARPVGSGGHMAVLPRNGGGEREGCPPGMECVMRTEMGSVETR